MTTATLRAEAPGPSSAQRALLLQATVLSHSTHAASATACVSELAAIFHASRVTLGFVRGGAVELAAVSGGQGAALSGPGFEAIACAMDETIDQGAGICLPAPAQARSLVRLAHARLLQRQGGAVATVPLLHAGEVIGAVTCEWSAPPQDAARDVERLETFVNLVGPVLYLMRLRESPWRQRAADALRHAWQRLGDVRDRRTQAVAATVALGLAAACIVPVPYRVGGHARIEGLLQRSLVAPADGFLKASHVRPGDHVVRGQVLAELADQDLALQHRKWTSELAQQESAHAVALARADRAALVVAMARAEQARAQLALVDADMQRASIQAPFDGVVLQGDLDQAIGSPLERGKPLFVIAPGQSYRVVLEIDERDIGEVRVGQAGTLSLAALPWETLPLRVSRLTPIARTVEGRNVFEVEAELAPEALAQAARIRPGLEGVAKLAVADQPWAWGVTHRVAEWLRLKAWSWWF